jgi:four helix bundle protein
MFAPHNSLLKLPLYCKAMSIVEITTMLTQIFDADSDELELAKQIQANAHLIPAKIAGAEAGDLYSIRMENAVVIKIAAKEMLSQLTLCKHLKLANNDYIHLLKEEIEQFRILFIQWVVNFDKSNDAKDDWSI